MANRIGRPPKYKKAFAKLIIKYFDIPLMKTVKQSEVKYKNGKTKKEFVEVVNDFPTFEGFCHSINVNGDTIVEWAKARWPADYPAVEMRNQLKYPEFSAAYTRAKQLQKRIWAMNSMRGLYNPQFAIFYGKNIFKDEFSDETKVDHTTGGKPMTVAVVSYAEAVKQVAAKQQAALPKPK